MPRKPNPSLIDAENPEWTEEMFARARPAPEVLEELGLRRRGERGPQKSPTKVQIAIRLDRDLVEQLRATGRGWQSRVNTALRRSLLRSKTSKKAAPVRAARKRA